MVSIPCCGNDASTKTGGYGDRLSGCFNEKTIVHALATIAIIGAVLAAITGLSPSALGSIGSSTIFNSILLGVGGVTLLLGVKSAISCSSNKAPTQTANEEAVDPKVPSKEG